MADRRIYGDSHFAVFKIRIRQIEGRTAHTSRRHFYDVVLNWMSHANLLSKKEQYTFSSLPTPRGVVTYYHICGTVEPYA